MQQATIVSRLLLLMAVLAGLRAGQAHCQGFLSRQGEQIVDAQGREVIFRGIGLGGWMLQEPYMLHLSGVAANQTQIRARIQDLVGTSKMEAFYSAWRQQFMTRVDIDSLASWGFNSIRVPLHYNLFSQGGPGWSLLDSLLGWCRADHIYLILDVHAAPGGQGNDIPIADRDKSAPSLWQSPADQAQFVLLWRRLAERYANEPWIGGYDLLNETNWGFSDSTDTHGCAESLNAPLRSLLIRATDTIRSVDRSHLLFVEGNCWANNFRGLLPVWDSNMALSFHKYWNYNDQGSVQGVINLRTQYQIPLWLGESGENSNTWTTDAIALAERNHISWTWWPLKKAGLNNPLEFPLPPHWKDLIDYWAGRGARPSASEAWETLMQLVSSASAAHNVYHRDVIDAMFRQVHSLDVLPYWAVVLRPGTRLYAVNYDLGRNGFAYYDMDTANYRVSTGHNSAGNRGGFYRNDGVDITQCEDTSSLGYSVMDIEAGEWMQYTVSVPDSRLYTISYRVSGAPEDVPTNVAVNVAYKAVAPSWELLDGTTSLDSCRLSVLSSGWVSEGNTRVYLTAGVHHLRFKADAPGFRLNYILFR
jgi:endoglucanase